MRIVIAVAMILTLSASAEAQRNCKKGIPCGGTCISATKTCHVGTPTADTTSRQGQPISPDDQAALVRRLTGDTGAKTSFELAPFVGSVDGNVYYSSGCTTAWKLTPEERVYFKSEPEAIAQGYHRSRAKGC
jgi:deoxyribonuclease I